MYYFSFFFFPSARWVENRTIFNTPNPRLMNVSLLRESKLLHGQERRGSKMSVRMPSRQPSMASLRPHSPNPSIGKSEPPRIDVVAPHHFNVHRILNGQFIPLDSSCLLIHIHKSINSLPSMYTSNDTHLFVLLSCLIN